MEDKARVEIKLDFPVNIEDILTVQFHPNNFRLVFDFILDVLKKHETVITNLHQQNVASSKNSQNESNNSELSSAIAKIEETLLSHHDSIEKLKEKSDSQDKQIKFNESKNEKILTNHEDSLKDIYQRLEQHQEQLNSQLRSIDAMRVDVDSHLKRIADAETKVTEMKEKTEKNTNNINDHEQRLRQLEHDVESLTKSIGTKIERRVEVTEIHDETRHSSTEASKAGNDAANELRDLTYRVKELEIKQRSTQERLDITSEIADKADKRTVLHEARINELEDALRKLDSFVKKLDLNHQKLNEDIELLRKLLKQFEESIRHKVDAEDFDQLRSMMNSQPGGQTAGGNSGGAGSISTKDLNLLRELGKRYDELREKVQSMSGFTPQFLEEILNRISKLEETMPKKADKSELDDLRSLLIKLKNDVERHESLLRLLEDRPSVSFGGGIEESGGAGVDSSKLNALSRRIAVIEEQLRSLVLPDGVDLVHMWNLLQRSTEDIKELREKIEKIYKELYSKIKELFDMFSNQASQDDLKNLEKSLQEKVIAVCDAMGKKFADKTDTKKALKYLERLIREIYESPTKERREGEDAMFAKKPLGGWSCASCEKQLEKLAGKVAGYQPWNKMPHRDPADRIARAGPGFSRMLATVNPEMLSNRTRTSNYHAQSPINSHFEEEIPANHSDVVNLPPVHKGDRPTSSN